MCGIVGGWWHSQKDVSSTVYRALNKIQHRGPDDMGCQLYPLRESVVALGHARLSIIDLSLGGHQPMHSHDGRFAIVFNGEIYNYRELRSELQALGQTFFSNSDTEVLLSAWAQWGSACLPRLIGMFAFAVLDKSNATLTCVRDAFGIKPLFFTEVDGNFAFASELPALLEMSPSKPELNWQQAYDYLVHGDYDTTHNTFFAGIYHLPPGNFMQVSTATGKIGATQQWWQPQVAERPGWRFGDAVECVREQFLQNIRLHLRSDVPLGAALSGGIDSSAVVCAMRYVEPKLPIHTFSFIADSREINEEHWVDRVNSHVEAIPHKVHISPNELVRDLDDMIRVQGEPFGSTSIYAGYRVFQLARDSGVIVMLDGQGADEMLAGYSGYPGQRLRSLLELGQIKDAWQFLNDWSQWPGRRRIDALKYLASEVTHGDLYEFLRNLDGRPTVPPWINSKPLLERGVQLQKPRVVPKGQAKGRRVIDELATSLYRRGLPALLRHGDRNSMRFSVESRVPFLTLDMANLLLSMPEEYLISPRGETKHVFRAAMRGIVPDDVLDRKDKVGFATPEKDWMIAMPDNIQKWVSHNLELPFFNQTAVRHILTKISNGERNYSWLVWRWINFSRWVVMYV